MAHRENHAHRKKSIVKPSMACSGKDFSPLRALFLFHDAELAL